MSAPRDTRKVHELFSEIDYEYLSQQKLTLINLLAREDAAACTGDANLGTTEREHLEGILALIESIQCDAAVEGYPVVWLSDTDTSTGRH